MLNLIIQLLSGAVGGNIAGNLLKKYNLGTLGNSIAGIVGGGLGGQLLAAMTGAGATAAGGLDLGAILASVFGGGIGGGIVMWIVGLIRTAMHKTA